MRPDLWAAALAAFLLLAPDLRPEERRLDHLLDLARAAPEDALDEQEGGITPALMLSVAFVESRFQTRDGQVLYRFRDACNAGLRDFCPRPLGVFQVVPDRRLGTRGNIALRTLEGNWRGAVRLMQLARRYNPERFVCHYGGGGHCAERYAAKVEAVRQPLRQVQTLVMHQGVCMELTDLAEHLICLPPEEDTP